MNMLVTMAEAKSWMNVSYSDKDASINLAIGAASKAVLAYLKSDGLEYADSSGEIIPGLVPDDIKMATIATAHAMFDDEANIARFADGDLPTNARIWIDHRRLPTLA